MKKNVVQYNLIARINHWLAAIVIVALFALGTWMVELDYYSPWYQDAPHWHKSVGLLLAGYTLFRLIWKVGTPSPKIDGAQWEKVTAKWAHRLMYVLMFSMFISGYLISTSKGRGIAVFDWFTIPSLGALFENQTDIAGQIHFYLAWLLICLAVVHAAAAIKHHVINKDNTLRKMTGVKNDNN